jgi:hypothetical protein
MTKLCSKLQNMNYKSLSACLNAEEEEKKGRVMKLVTWCRGGGGALAAFVRMSDKEMVEKLAIDNCCSSC